MSLTDGGISLKRTYVAFGITLLFLGNCIIPSAPSESTQGIRIITVDDEPGDADFTSIKEAVNASNPGDTIEVYSGTYYEGEIRITKENVSLLGISHELGDGNDSGQPFIKGIFGNGTKTADIIQIVASHVTVSNLYIQNLGWKISDYYSIVRIGDELQENTIEGCTISDCNVSRAIIGIFCNHVGPLDNTTLINNRLFGFQSFGMLIESDNDTTTEGDFTITGNVIIDCSIGIYLKSDRENVSGNSIRLCEFFGITLHGNHNIIYGNDFDNCSVGVSDYDLSAHDNVIIKNNFKSYSRGKLWWAKPPSYIITILNIFGKKEWKQNYWDTWRSVGPKVVPGGLIVGEKIPIIWFNFDWRPAKEPYDITGMT
jgi:parallel beta-helix repeat protein